MENAALDITSDRTVTAWPGRINDHILLLSIYKDVRMKAQSWYL